MTTLEKTIEELKNLPSDKLDSAAMYIRALVEEDRARRFRLLRAARGCISEEDANAFEEAIADCERIDQDEW